MKDGWDLTKGNRGEERFRGRYSRSKGQMRIKAGRQEDNRDNKPRLAAVQDTGRQPGGPGKGQEYCGNDHEVSSCLGLAVSSALNTWILSF